MKSLRIDECRIRNNVLFFIQFEDGYFFDKAERQKNYTEREIER